MAQARRELVCNFGYYYVSSNIKGVSELSTAMSLVAVGLPLGLQFSAKDPLAFFHGQWEAQRTRPA